MCTLNMQYLKIFKNLKFKENYVKSIPQIYVG